MNYRQAMKALKSAGTAQNRKIYARHGVLEPMFGVSTANLTKIGPVDVDHGETGCKTPDAVPYIERIWEHKTRKTA